MHGEPGLTLTGLPGARGRIWPAQGQRPHRDFPRQSLPQSEGIGQNNRARNVPQSKQAFRQPSMSSSTVGHPPNLTSTPIPAPGQVVRCRTRTWLVESVDPSPHGAKVALACLDDDAQGDQLEVIWDLELGTEIVDREAWQKIGSRGFDDPR